MGRAATTRFSPPPTAASGCGRSRSPYSRRRRRCASIRPARGGRNRSTSWSPPMPGACPSSGRGGGRARRGAEADCRTWHGLGRAPDLAGDLDDEAELGNLVLDRDLVPLDRAREAALRAQAKLVERQKARRLVDAALQFVLALQRRQLA